MPTTKAHFEAIGRVAYEWSRLEQVLQTAIALVADIDKRKSLIMTNAGSVKSWTEALSRLVDSTVYKPELSKRTRKLGERISEQLSPQRNMVIHGVWAESWEAVVGDNASPLPNLTSFLHIVKKSGRHMEMAGELTADDVRQIAESILDAHEDLLDLTEALVAALPDRQRITFPRPRRRRNRQG